MPTRVLLADNVDVSSALGASIVLHELVHVLQARDGAATFGSPLWHRREREAYEVQRRYLMRRGVAIPGLFGFDAADD